MEKNADISLFGMSVCRYVNLSFSLYLLLYSSMIVVLPVCLSMVLAWMSDFHSTVSACHCSMDAFICMSVCMHVCLS